MMNRRTFLKQVMFWSTGISLQVPIFKITPNLIAKESSLPLLSHGKGKNYPKLVNNLINSLGGIGQFIKKGDKVVIKPNIGWDRSPEQAANTHPQLVAALAEHALSAGASKVLIFDRTCNEERRCYVNSGIKDALDSIKNKRLHLFHPDPRKFIPVNIEQGKGVNRLEIYKDALDADSYINVPVAKHHGLSKLTLGLKNSMGVLGGDRGSLHHNLGQKLADLATVIRPQLTVIDATRILLRNGPQGGSLRDVKVLDTIIASPDPVACDAFATTLFAMNPDEIESTVAAYKMGLGEMDIQKMKVVRV